MRDCRVIALHVIETPVRERVTQAIRHELRQVDNAVCDPSVSSPRRWCLVSFAVAIARNTAIKKRESRCGATLSLGTFSGADDRGGAAFLRGPGDLQQERLTTDITERHVGTR